MACGYRMGIIGSLSFVPDGSTVTPTNDVPTWLKCAGIPTTTYTTLSEVLADTSLLRILINSENAIDYLVRCKEWISLGEGLVPTMTSDTTPSGVCSASSVYSSSYPAWKVFDKDLNVSSSWVSNGTTNQWVKYRFPTAQCVKSVSIYTNFASGGDSAIKNFRIEGSNDDSTYTTIYTGIYLNQSGNQIFSFSNNESYLYYRLYVLDRYATTSTTIQFVELQYYASEEGLTDSQSAMQFIGANDYASNLLLGDSDWCEAICNSEYFEDVLNIKVPTMTSNNTPSGVASASSYTSGYEAYGVFNPGRKWVSNSQTNDQWVQYQFTAPNCAKKVVLTKDTNLNRAKDVIIKGSNDGVIWDNLLSTTLDNTSQSETLIVPNDINYLYYQLYITNTYSSATIALEELQFYGRDKGGVQSWLLSANITNKNYTTVSQVLADTDTLTALISSHNAMDYLVTCTSWANDICSNQTAMTLIGNDNYASNKLIENEIWLTAILNSSYYNNILNIEVPTMTSNTTPSGIASATHVGAYEPFKAFDKNTSTYWSAGSTTVATIYYEFEENVKICAVSYKGYALNNTASDIDIVDGNDTVKYSKTLSNTADTQKFGLTQNFNSNKVGLKIKTMYNNTSSSAVEVNFYGRVDV